MHETDMTRALIQTLRDWWQSQPGQPPCVEPASLQFAYAAQTQGTFLQGSQLIIRETPLIAYCHPCGQEYKPEMGRRYACPHCGSPMEEIRSGRELKIDHIECLIDSAPAAQPEVA